MTTRAVLYTRVCVDDGQNLAEQLETCRQHARQHDWHVVEELTEREASGNLLERPQLNQALEMAQAGEFDILIVRDPYRLSRELTKLLTIETEVKQHGVEIEYILPGRLNTVPADLVQAVMAELPAVRRRRQPKGRKENQE